MYNGKRQRGRPSGTAKPGTMRATLHVRMPADLLASARLATTDLGRWVREAIRRMVEK